MRGVPRLSKIERATLEACNVDDYDLCVKRVHALPGGGEKGQLHHDVMESLTKRGLAEWRTAPALNPPYRVRLGVVRPTHAGLEALQFDTPSRRFAAWLFGGIPKLLWSIIIAVSAAATGAAITVWLQK